jgi:hypothetical protein
MIRVLSPNTHSRITTVAKDTFLVTVFAPYFSKKLPFDVLEVLTFKMSFIDGFYLKEVPVDLSWTINKAHCGEALVTYKRLLADTNYTTRDSDQITLDISNEVVDLCCRLFTCGFNGSSAHQDLFFAMEKDFFVMRLGYHSEIYADYKEVFALREAINLCR